MKTKTKYPKWFNAKYKPSYKPTPPPKNVWDYKTIETVTASEHDYYEINKLPEGTNCLTVHIDKDYYDNSVYGVEIIFANKKEVPNPKYDKLYELYEKNLKEYNAQIKEWKKWKKIWDAEMEVANKEHRKRNYKKLKKELAELEKEFGDD